MGIINALSKPLNRLRISFGRRFFSFTLKNCKNLYILLESYTIWVRCTSKSYPVIVWLCSFNFYVVFVFGLRSQIRALGFVTICATLFIFTSLKSTTIEFRMLHWYNPLTFDDYKIYLFHFSHSFARTRKDRSDGKRNW